MAGVALEPGERYGRRGLSLEARNPAHTALIDDLVVAVAGMHLGLEVLRDQLGWHNVVDVDEAAPELRMLQRQCSAQTPQDRVRRVRPITFVDRLGVAGDDVQSRRRPHPGEGGDKPPRLVEHAITRRNVEAGGQRRWRIDHVVGPGERIAKRGRVAALRQHRG